MAIESGIKVIGIGVGQLDNPYSGLFSGNTTIQTVDLRNYPTHWAFHSFKAAFRNCTNLKSVTGINLTDVTNMRNMFLGCTNLESISYTGNPVSVNMTNTYMECEKLTTVSIEGANTLDGTCTDCKSLTTVTGTINSNCHSMVGTFINCISLSSIFNIPSSINNISNAFSGCIALRNPPVFEGNNISAAYAFNSSGITSTPDLSKFTNVQGMFSGCGDLTTVNGNFRSDIEDLNETFYYCWRLTSVPTIPASVTRMYRTFSYCQNLTSYSKVPSNNEISMGETFSNCTRLLSADVNNAKDLNYTFKECTNLLNCTGTISPNNDYMNYTFDFCTSLISAPTIPSNSILLEMNATFNNCTSLPTVPEIPASVKKLWFTFNHCDSLTGNVIIRSEIVEDVTGIFDSTTLTKYVYIPYESWIDDGAGGQIVGPSTTYTTFINAGFDELGTKNGVYLRDLATLQ